MPLHSACVCALAKPRAKFAALILNGALLAACQTVPVVKPPQVLAPLPPLPPLITQNTAHYSVRADLSDVRFLVYRAGPLAGFGHNHVILARHIQGDIYLGPDLQHSAFLLTLPVKSFQVDNPAARAVAGPDFASSPSAQAIQGTDINMLSAGELDAAEHPDIRIRSVRFVGPEWRPDATVRIEVRGVARDITAPIALQHCGEQLIATGAFQIKQSDFGIRPFSILGGGLQVADTVKVRFHLVAQRD